MKLLAFTLLLCLAACSYNLGHENRSIPGGHKTVFVNMFENQSQEVGAEAFFTSALITELQRSGFVVVTEKDSAEVVIDGLILDVLNSGSVSIPTFHEVDNINKEAKSFQASMFTEYLLTVSANLKVRRTRDNKVIWQTYLQNQRGYRGPLLKKDGLRSSNPLYNQSTKSQTMRLLAKDMMAEAFDRLTENF